MLISMIPAPKRVTDPGIQRYVPTQNKNVTLCGKATKSRKFIRFREIKAETRTVQLCSSAVFDKGVRNVCVHSQLLLPQISGNATNQSISVF